MNLVERIVAVHDAFNTAEIPHAFGGVESPIGELAGRLMGCRSVNFFFDATFTRSHDTQFRTPFHQDEPYWSVEGSDCASAWSSRSTRFRSPMSKPTGRRSPLS